MCSMIMINMTIVMKDIVTNGIYNYVIFVTSDKQNVSVRTSSHVVMTNCTCDLGQQHQSLMQSQLPCFDIVFQPQGHFISLWFSNLDQNYLSLGYVLRTKEKNFSIVINYGMANTFNIQFIPITRLILEAYKSQIWSRFCL